jgi:hypothetical protein
MYNVDGSPAGSVSVPDPFDVHEYNGQLLISDIAGDNIGRYDYDLTFIDLFHDSAGIAGIDFPQQLNTRPSNGNLLAAGFTAPNGIFEYTPDGVQVGPPISVGGLRGVYPLGNGNLMYTKDSGVYVYDITAATSTLIHACNPQFINRLVLGPARCGPADVGSTGGVSGADGVLDNNDFVVFIDTFFAQAPAADVGVTGGVPGADGAWDNNDFIVYIDQFFAGC